MINAVKIVFSTLILLSLLVNNSILSAQQQPGNQPGGGGGNGGGNPPLAWAITDPAGDLPIAGTQNVINIAGTWPVNDPGWPKKFVSITVEPFTLQLNGQPVEASRNLSFELDGNVSGIWAISMAFPGNLGFVEQNWPAGANCKIAIGQVRYIATPMILAGTGSVVMVPQRVLDIKDEKRVSIR